MTAPAPQAYADARRVIANPSPGDSLSLRTHAWLVMLQSRGIRANLLSLYRQRDRQERKADEIRRAFR